MSAPYTVGEGRRSPSRGPSPTTYMESFSAKVSTFLRYRFDKLDTTKGASVTVSLGGILDTIATDEGGVACPTM